MYVLTLKYQLKCVFSPKNKTKKKRKCKMVIFALDILVYKFSQFKKKTLKFTKKYMKSNCGHCKNACEMAKLKKSLDYVYL